MTELHPCSAYLYNTLKSKRTILLTKISRRQIQRLESAAGVILSFDSELKDKKDILDSKRESLAAFLQKHPWINIDLLSPYNTLVETFLTYRQLLDRTDQNLLVECDGSLGPTDHQIIPVDPPQE
ncbi:hypothetical protein TVAG_443290 [Trichomonas vaginalis G3]|uniref:Uncharacterized protein n=1 Tax=Trichomonas vaginalis (strain ATCC PRA-98 / G3) TaxID=412133 RepID=A2F3P1_TRIV3|nr:hypothetical protein TVAGG3_0778240 [Trichomonas vaginalis G3]EAY00459.1 hypothetical protein TVAG_443290 [Trichomonas vaginalis G3]KAI5494869.1 hypothetical protein TVAGG3_0778240 [Trichomonas vaginalis G3]|eukprot:XP_001313388.1 hypothetical protein [Trichomonas vaginalis G3]